MEIETSRLKFAVIDDAYLSPLSTQKVWNLKYDQTVCCIMATGGLTTHIIMQSMHAALKFSHTSYNK